MPDSLLDSRSEFDLAKTLLGRWLRDTLGYAKTLRIDTLGDYGDRRTFVAGWHIEIIHNGHALTFHVLVDGQFPYSPIRVALKFLDIYLRWPHVEPGGLLCLPRIDPPSAGIGEAIDTTLSSAIDLFDKCQEAEFVESELRREFLSYWNRSDHPKAKRFRSLLDTKNDNTREISVWHGQESIVVGENPDQVRSWLKNRGTTDYSVILPGIFGNLDQAPIPPYAGRPIELFALLHAHCPETLPLLSKLPIDKEVSIVLAAGSPNGEGLMGFHLSAPKLDGFRKGGDMNAATKMQLWKLRSQLKRSEVDRYDAAWVHGRGLNEQQANLFAANVLVLGCGSLGSQVAMRLGQAGIGGLTLVDPDLLASANVGRHVLGINSVRRSKSAELASELRRRYPHMHTIEAYEDSWQVAYQKDTKVFDRATLIVACLGEWTADGQLGEWHARSGTVPIVYGWLDEFGVAVHALALTSAGPSLGCVLSLDGHLRVPETIWPGDGLIRAEPACGTLYQPYGPIDVAHADALVSRLCIDILTSNSRPPVHRVYAGPTTEVAAAGGEWSREHLNHRPSGYDGPFEYERTIVHCGECFTCKERA